MELGDGNLLVVVLCVVILVSGVVQSMSGFGFALLSAPVLTALIGGPATVSTLMIAGTACEIAMLVLRRSAPRPDVRETLTLAGWSVPGMVTGALLLAALPATGLQVFVAVVVVAAVLLRLRAPARHVVADGRWAIPAGLLSGALSTSTSLSGPPAVYYLVHRQLPPEVMRDTLVSLSLVRLPVSVIALLTAGVWAPHPGWPALVVAALAGQFLGARIFHGYARHRYEHLVLALLTAAALASLLPLLLR